MKTPVVIGRVLKVAVVAGVAIAIMWQARQDNEVNGQATPVYMAQKASFVPQPWVEHRKVQMKELTKAMPNRFALSKAYYGREDALLEAMELERKKSQVETGQALPKS